MPTAGHLIEPEELSAYIDGELTPGRAVEVSAHLEACIECGEIVAALRGVSVRMKAWEVEAPRMTAPASKTPRRFSLWWAVPVTAAAAVVALFVVPRPESRAVVPSAEKAALLVRPRMAALEGPMGALSMPAPVPQRDAAVSAPMIVRTAELSLTAHDFNACRAALEAAAKRYNGYIASINANAPDSAGRSLEATLRVPSNNLDSLLADLRKLGRVTQETQSGNDVTKEYVDLDARLRNAQNTEQRLAALERDRTAKLSDVLSVETEIARVREEIERMTAQKRNLQNSVDLATLRVTISENFKAQVNVLPASAGDRLAAATREGYRSVTESLLDAVEFALAWGPTILIWSALLFWPARWLWRRVRRTA